MCTVNIHKKKYHKLLAFITLEALTHLSVQLKINSFYSTQCFMQMQLLWNHNSPSSKYKLQTNLLFSIVGAARVPAHRSFDRSQSPVDPHRPAVHMPMSVVVFSWYTFFIEIKKYFHTRNDHKRFFFNSKMQSLPSLDFYELCQ